MLEFWKINIGEKKNVDVDKIWGELLLVGSTLYQKGGEIMEERKPYEAPKLLEYGSIADRTFQTPGGVKGCQTDCHIDNFGENSANAVS